MFCHRHSVVFSPDHRAKYYDSLHKRHASTDEAAQTTEPPRRNPLPKAFRSGVAAATTHSEPKVERAKQHHPTKPTPTVEKGERAVGEKGERAVGEKGERAVGEKGAGTGGENGGRAVDGCRLRQRTVVCQG